MSYGFSLILTVLLILGFYSNQALAQNPAPAQAPNETLSEIGDILSSLHSVLEDLASLEANTSEHIARRNQLFNFLIELSTRNINNPEFSVDLEGEYLVITFTGGSALALMGYTQDASPTDNSTPIPYDLSVTNASSQTLYVDGFECVQKEYDDSWGTYFRVLATMIAGHPHDVLIYFRNHNICTRRISL